MTSHVSIRSAMWRSAAAGKHELETGRSQMCRVGAQSTPKAPRKKRLEEASCDVQTQMAAATP